ncbi:MAG: MG2 domain-containing protein [Candidatus Bathyarchaeota archaeon]|nr:MG2 domain-containing protein [Candidatus Bathyarchaeota archaeon]
MPYLGETIRVRATLTDYDGSALTPDSQEVALYGPDGAQQGQSTSPVSEGGGVYYVDFEIPSGGAKGNWKAVWKATKSAGDGIGEVEFFVDRAP